MFVALRWPFSILSVSCLSVGTRIVLHIRDVDKRFVHWRDHFFVFVLEVSGNEPQNPAYSFAAFLCLFLLFDVFGDDS